MYKRRLTSSAFALSTQLLARIVSAASGAVVIALLTRGMTKEDFGTFSLGLTLVAIGLGLADFGVSQVAIQRMSADPKQQSHLLAALLSTRAVLGLAFAAIAGVGILATVPGTADQLTLIVVVLAVPLSCFQAYRSLAQARLTLNVVTVSLLVQNLSWLAAVAVLAVVGASLLAFATAFAATSAASGLVAAWMVHRQGFRAEWLDKRAAAKELLWASWPLGVGGLLVTAYYRLSAIFIYIYGTAADVATFALAFRFVDVLQFLPLTLQTLLLPVLSAAFVNDDTEAAQRSWDRLFSLYLCSGLAVVVGGMVCAPQLVELLAGAGYDSSVPLLRVLLMAFACICVAYAFTGALIAADANQMYLKSVAAWAFVNVTLNLLLIPTYGATAAAWTTLVTEFGVTATLGARLAKLGIVRLPVRQIVVAAVAASATLGVGVLLAQAIPALLAAVCAGLLYLAVVDRLGIIAIADAVSSRRAPSKEEATSA